MKVKVLMYPLSLCHWIDNIFYHTWRHFIVRRIFLEICRALESLYKRLCGGIDRIHPMKKNSEIFDKAYRPFHL